MATATDSMLFHRIDEVTGDELAVEVLDDRTAIHFTIDGRGQTMLILNADDVFGLADALRRAGERAAPR